MTTISDDARLLVGLGCSTSATQQEIVALIAACLSEAGCTAAQIVAFATHSRKRGSSALIGAAAYYGVPLLFLDDAAVSADYPGTCEAVAAAAGPVLLGKRKSRYATCAISSVAPETDLARLAQPFSPSAAIASSTLATSLAGP